IVGYSAPAKGNTFLNYCGVGSDEIDFVADLNPAKQNHLLPGSRIPIRSPEDLFEAKPEYVLILAWNLRKEISKQLSRVGVWGGRFVVGIPFIDVFIG
ncbi:MAG: methyltransferase C-terminal domain-containing protein, partial [Rhodothermia bacterium]